MTINTYMHFQALLCLKMKREQEQQYRKDYYNV